MSDHDDDDSQDDDGDFQEENEMRRLEGRRTSTCTERRGARGKKPASVTQQWTAQGDRRAMRWTMHVVRDGAAA